jgi:hypothetical protein
MNLINLVKFNTIHLFFYRQYLFIHRSCAVIQIKDIACFPPIFPLFRIIHNPLPKPQL